ncbi:uncharacterized protein [Epargyreus clarus]|uniref:uncharacterized protein n=1 Tax=Epargyreus clarus TaxID=520877 RepID=UPI003C2AC20A
MQTVLESKSGIRSSESSNVSRAKGISASAPIVPIKQGELKTQISAPSYFYSLKENETPPFKKPEKEEKPRLLLNTLFCEEDVVEMIAAYDSDPDGGFKKCLGDILVKKKITENYNLSEKTFLIGLVTETIDYAAQRDFSARKLACLLTLYMKTHLYFKWYYWISPIATWHYFKEILIRHTIEDSPDSQEVFEPDECYDILSHFHTVYLTNLPLVHIQTFGAHRLKLLWPFKPK